MKTSPGSPPTKSQSQLLVLLSFVLLIAAPANMIAALSLHRQLAALLSTTPPQTAAEHRQLRPALTNRSETNESVDCVAAITRVEDAVRRLLTHADAVGSAIAEITQREAQLPQPMLQPQPFVPAAARGRPPSPAAPTSLLSWRQTAPTDTVAYVDDVFRWHSAETRERIAVETDPDHPEPAVVMRIMQESRDELSAQLRAVLPPEEYELLFPELRIPSGEQH
jgi:hypothetical protein